MVSFAKKQPPVAARVVKPVWLHICWPSSGDCNPAEAQFFKLRARLMKSLRRSPRQSRGTPVFVWRRRR
jgi:hypothetical protein